MRISALRGLRTVENLQSPAKMEVLQSGILARPKLSPYFVAASSIQIITLSPGVEEGTLLTRITHRVVLQPHTPLAL